jgi:Ca2+/H+ antiporter, TMEM165/GDT1 family
VTHRRARVASEDHRPAGHLTGTRPIIGLVDPVTLAIHATPAFVASAVEFVEATTIVLAVGVTRGWRAPLVGTIAATVTLAIIIATLGVAIVTIVPELLLKGIVGALLLLFGLRWLRKAVLRFAGIVAVHDEELIYQRELAELRAQGLQRKEFDWIGFLVAYKAVLLEGTEVAFIVIAFGAAGGTALTAATVGAIAAGLVVIALGAALRQPLTMVPENWLKFGVGAMLCSFGVFWFAEALGMAWPGDALSIPLIVAAFLAASWLAVRMLRALLPEGAQVEARNV